MNCIIVDDEPMALDIITDYIEKIPYLNLKASFRNSLDALDYIQKNKIDLLFLDINMPDLTGMQFLKSLNDHPAVIFTTAYSQYALESYDYNAIDYLLKPIEFDRFLKAVNKANQQFQLSMSAKIIDLNAENGKKPEYIFIKCGTKTHRVILDDIIYVESAGNYVVFVLKNSSLMTLLSMSRVLELIPRNKFIRVHKSFIVSLKHISMVERHQLKIADVTIPIGNVYRENFFNILKKK